MQPKPNPSSFQCLLPNRQDPRPAQILMVEDNPGDVRLLREAFKEGGILCKLHITRDGEQAMAFLHQQGVYSASPRPALVLLDLNLPRKDGRQVLEEIKSEPGLKRIPVVILSTSTRPEDVTHAYDHHANCYLAKPSDMESLISMGKLIECFWLRFAVLPA